MNNWQITYAGATKSLAAWGVCDDISFDAGHKQKMSVKLRSVEDFDAATPQFAYGQPVTVLLNGAIWFQGFCDSPSRVNNGGKQHIGYQFHDALWMLGRHIFCQWRLQTTSFGLVGGAPLTFFTQKINPEVFLGQVYALSFTTYTLDGGGTRSTPTLTAPPANTTTNGDQIREVVRWFNECFNPTRRGSTIADPSAVDVAQDMIQMGTIDVAVKMPVTRQSGVTCLEAILTCIRWSPDAILSLDTTTTPPTINVTAALDSVTVDITAEQEKQIRVARTNETELPGVVIHYASTSEIMNLSGQTVVSTTQTDDIYPPGVTDFTPLVSRHFVELAGAKLSRVYSAVVTASVLPALSGDVDWWRGFYTTSVHGDIKSHDAALQDSCIKPDTILVGQMAGATALIQGVFVPGKGAIVTLDEDAIIGGTQYYAGDDVTAFVPSRFPNELVKGCIATWMGTGHVKVTMSAVAQYHKYEKPYWSDPPANTTPTTDNVVVQKVSYKNIKCRIVLTSATTHDPEWDGSLAYSVIKNSVAAEVVPTGVAQAVYTSMATPRFSGSIEFVAEQVKDVRIGQSLNLVAPNNTYGNCVVQSVSGNPTRGTIAVSFAPVSRLDAPALIELQRATRMRTAYNMTDGGRSDGSWG